MPEPSVSAGPAGEVPNCRTSTDSRSKQSSSGKPSYFSYFEHLGLLPWIISFRFRMRVRPVLIEWRPNALGQRPPPKRSVDPKRFGSKKTSREANPSPGAGCAKINGGPSRARVERSKKVIPNHPDRRCPLGDRHIKVARAAAGARGLDRPLRRPDLGFPLPRGPSTAPSAVLNGAKRNSPRAERRRKHPPTRRVARRRARLDLGAAPEARHGILLAAAEDAEPTKAGSQ